MSKRHERVKPKARVAEPVQVYLAAPDHDLLGRLVAQLDATKSDVLRLGLQALERQLADPATHPALRIIGLADRETAPPAGYDVIREHDRALADCEAAAWRPAGRNTRGR